MDESQSSLLVFIILLLVIFNSIAFTLLKGGIKIVRQAEVMVVERFGKYRRILKPGLHFIIPIVDKPRKIHWRYLDVKAGQQQATITEASTEKIDLREHVLDFGRQHVITKDTVSMEIDALVYYQIVDPRLVVYRIENLPLAIELLVKTTLRELIARISLDDSFSSREKINAELLNNVSQDAQRWGVSILRVEVVNIMPPNDIKSAMENQIKAERSRIATVLRADGNREKSIVQSRGKCERIVRQAMGHSTQMLQEADGEAKAKLKVAEAEAKAIEMLRDAILDTGFQKRRAVDYLVAVQYLTTIRLLASQYGESEVVLIPRDTVEALSEIEKIVKKA